MAGTRQLHITERPHVPLLSVILGYGPMLPFAIGALIAWTFDGPWRDELLFLTIVWGACILTFLAGVRRGLSFRTEGIIAYQNSLRVQRGGSLLFFSETNGRVVNLQRQSLGAEHLKIRSVP